MNLLVDIGNTRTKVAVADNTGIIWKNDFDSFTNNDFTEIPNNEDLTKCIISSVKKELSMNLEFLILTIPYVLYLDNSTKLPIKNLYGTPDTLGKDRLAAAVGANNIYPGYNVLIIDAGTAITYDIITENAEYLGGNIAPGMQMRYRALNAFTDKLPLLNPSEKFPIMGNNTESAIVAGVQLGMIYEIEGYLKYYENKFTGKFKAILTGGDSIFFENNLKSAIFVNYNLTLIGLNRILEHNAHEK